MATRTVKARVGLDGEKEYKQALSELNKGNQVLASEMKKLQAQFKGNEDSTEALTAKGEVLEKQLLQQKDKVETLRQALANAANEYGEADKRTQDWQIQLNNAEAQQYKLEQAVEENNRALNSQGEEMQELNEETVGLGDGIDELAGKFGIHLPDGVKSALNSVGDFSTGTVAAMAAAAAAVVAVVEAFKKLNEITLEAAHNADELVTESMKTGLTTETIQKWKYAEEFIDVSYDTISKSLTKLTKNMDAARDGNESTAESFAKLGVSVTDSVTGELRPAEDVFYEVIDALGQVENATERDAMSMEILGKSAKELNPLIVQGSDALRELGDEAVQTGYVLDESQIAKLTQVDDQYQRTQKAIESTKNELALQFAPASESALTLFANLMEKAGAALERSQLIENLATIIGSLLDMFSSIADLISQIPLFQYALDALRIALGAVANIIDGISRGIQTIVSAMQGDFSNIGQIWSGYGAQWTSLLGRNASGNDNWRGGLTYLNESGPELAMLPSGTQIYNAQDTRAMGGTTWYVTIDAKNVKEFNDIVELAESARVRGRMK